MKLHATTFGRSQSSKSVNRGIELGSFRIEAVIHWPSIIRPSPCIHGIAAEDIVQKKCKKIEIERHVIAIPNLDRGRG